MSVVSLSSIARLARAAFIAPAVCLGLALLFWSQSGDAVGGGTDMPARLRSIQHIAAVSMAISAGTWLLLGLSVLAAGHWQAWRARRLPETLPAVVQRVRNRLIPVLVATTAALAVTVASAAIWAGIAIALGGPLRGALPILHDGAVLVCGALVLFVLFDLFQFVSGVRALRHVLVDVPVVSIVGRAVTEPEATALWRAVRAEATAQGASVPDRIALGFIDAAFVTAAPVRLQPEAQVFDGCTLHLPLLALAHLDVCEMRALIAHELSHVRHGDIGRALAIEREQRRLAAALDTLVRTGTRAQLDGLLTWPVYRLARYIVAALDKAAAANRRAQELRADRAAAEATSASVAAAMLLRTAACQHVAQRALTACHQGEVSSRERPFALADRWLQTHAMPCIEPAPGPADAHARHPTLGQRLAALEVDYDAALIERVERAIEPQAGALARCLDDGRVFAERIDCELATLLADDYARWLHDLISRKRDTPRDNTYYLDMRGPIVLCAGFGGAALSGAWMMATPRWAPIDSPFVTIVLAAVGVFAMALAVWRASGQSPVAVRVSDTSLISRYLREPIPIHALEHIGFDRRHGQLTVGLWLRPGVPVPRVRRLALGGARRHARHHQVVLRFGPLRDSAGQRIDHDRFATRLEAALQGHAARAALDPFGPDDKPIREREPT